MIQIPLNVDVQCTDGVIGKSSSIIVNRETLQPTHFVIKEKQRPHTERLVPIGTIEKSEADKIQLNCTTSDIQNMQEFIVNVYTQVDNMSFESSAFGTSQPFMYAVPTVSHYESSDLNIPEGGVAVNAGMVVEASNGKVGKVVDLWEDPNTGQITHFVMNETHIWGGKRVVVPLTLVRFTDSTGVYLKVDKETISAMLAVPTRGMGDLVKTSLAAAVFPNTNKAKPFLESLKKNKNINFSNAALFVKESDGKTSVRETHDLDKKRGGVFGAITGGLMGLIGGPVGMVVGAATGALTGRVAAGRIDMGFPNQYLNRLQEALKPGKSAVLVLLDDDQLSLFAEAVENEGGVFIDQKLTQDILEKASGTTEASKQE